MSDPKTVLEGTVKYRDRKKWKARWAVVSKLSPVADCLHLQLYRDSKERCKNGPTKASLSLEGFLGMETGFTLDKESNTIALICNELVVVLAFDSREVLMQWQVKIRANLAEEQQFLVQIAHLPSKSKLSCGPARLHLQDYTFCVVAGVPPRLLGTWPIKELRRFGVVEGKFCFEGGSLCGKGEGLHVLLTNQCEELAQAMDLASKGKLLGKKKALSRKNSVLECSTRTPMHKALRNASEKCNTTDSGRPLLSSGSECSTCDACSEILRSGCEESTYNCASAKASSCRIHYRWPSCMSRWGQSSTITTSDVESMDTVSVTLSDYQGPHSTVSSKSSNHGTSLLCLCDARGTWPFNHCNQCGRQFYSRSSLGHQEGRHQRLVSPEVKIEGLTGSGFSPQWTMDSALISPSNDGCRSNSNKDSAYQLMVPTSDRASLCSHTSRSSSTSTASSSGSEYSVPRNHLDSLYDKPRALHAVKSNTTFTKKTGAANGVPHLQVIPPSRNSGCKAVALTKERLCLCHVPISDRNMPEGHPHLPCPCWNQLAFTMKTEKGVANVISIGQNSTAASPPSPKKVQANGGTATFVKTLPPVSQDLPCTCHRGNEDQYMHYAVPRSALANVFPKEQELGTRPKEEGTITENPLSAEYDVPKKFMDILASSDMALKSSLKALDANTACSCRSIKMPVSQTRIQQTSETKIFHRYESSQPDSIQMCTCQRLVLWAGSFVPCLGGPTHKSTDHGWQCNKGIGYPNGNSRAVPNHYGTICCEPPRTAEVVLVNGKPKHLICSQKMKENISAESSSGSEKCLFGDKDVSEPDPNSIGCASSNQEGFHSSSEFQSTSSSSIQNILASNGASTTNYANLDFAQSLSLYENSTAVLNRLETNEFRSSSPEKPPLPPRGLTVNPNFGIGSTSSHASGVIPKSNVQFQVCPMQKQQEHKQVANSAYELMDFENQAAGNCQNDDYLMMQPVFYDKLQSDSKTVVNPDDTKGLPTQTAISEDSPELPLRPFMPFSYPHLDINGESNDSSTKSPEPQSEIKYNFSDIMTRKCHLINEDIELRSARSNSFSELKKIVLLRKRSSSVDGKNNPISSDQGAKSNPASPICSPKPSAQRKVSLFSKLNLRSKEKSMSTNEINPPAALPTSPNLLHTYRRCNLHRSADCLKVNEEYVNSDDDLSNDASEASIKENVSMKRSSSVPCRSALPANLPSPRKLNVPVIPELSDVNKISADCEQYFAEIESDKDLIHRTYSLGSQDKPNKMLDQGYKSDCDNACKQGALTESRGDMVHIQGIQRGVHSLGINPSDRHKSTTSSSSSDTSDFIESLSHCSRSSSTSSGSSCDYMRSDDMYLKKCAKSMHSEIPSSICGAISPLPRASKPQAKFEDSSHPCMRHNLNHSHRNHLYSFINNSAASSSPILHIAEESDHNLPATDSIYHVKKPDIVMIQSTTVTAVLSSTANATKSLNPAKSPTSPSSLSTSPSTTDYSSSSSGNFSISTKSVKITGEISTRPNQANKLCLTGSHSLIKQQLLKKNHSDESRITEIDMGSNGALSSKNEKSGNL